MARIISDVSLFRKALDLTPIISLRAQLKNYYYLSLHFGLISQKRKAIEMF